MSSEPEQPPRAVISRRLLLKIALGVATAITAGVIIENSTEDPVRRNGSVLTPEQFGAVGDGTTDDTRALQAMFDAAATRRGQGGGGMCLLGAKTYLFTKPLVIKAQALTVQGVAGGASIDGTSEIVGGSVLLSGVRKGVALTFSDESGNPGPPVRGLRLRDVYFHGSGAEEVLVRVVFPLDGLIQGCKFAWSGGTGVELARPQNLTFMSNDVRRNNGWGAILTPFGTSGTGNGQTCKIIANTFFGNDRAGIGTGGLSLASGAEHVVTSNGFELHDDPKSVALLVGSFRSIITSNVFEANACPIEFGTASAPSRATSVAFNKILGGEIRFTSYGLERFHHNHLQDYKDTRPWSATFSRDSKPADTRWHDNVELPAGRVGGQIRDDAPSGHVSFGQLPTQSTWNGNHLALGAFHLWVDDRGELRIKRGAPDAHDDGTVVGA